MPHCERRAYGTDCSELAVASVMAALGCGGFSAPSAFLSVLVNESRHFKANFFPTSNPSSDVTRIMAQGRLNALQIRSFKDRHG